MRLLACGFSTCLRRPTRDELCKRAIEHVLYTTSDRFLDCETSMSTMIVFPNGMIQQIDIVIIHTQIHDTWRIKCVTPTYHPHIHAIYKESLPAFTLVEVAYNICNIQIKLYGVHQVANMLLQNNPERFYEVLVEKMY